MTTHTKTPPAKKRIKIHLPQATHKKLLIRKHLHEPYKPPHTSIGTDLDHGNGHVAVGLRQHLKGRLGGFAVVLATKEDEAQSKGEELGEGVFEVGLGLFHQCLQDGGTHVAVTRAHRYHAARHRTHSHHLVDWLVWWIDG